MAEERPSRFWRRLIPILSNPYGLALDRFLMRVFDRSLIGHMYMRAGGFPTSPHLLLRTIHWKTGRVRTVVLPFRRSRDEAGRERYLVVGSHGGRPTDPIWTLNIRAHPPVWFRVDRRWRFGHAHVAQGAERERLWQEITANGRYLQHQKWARPRVLPVVVLAPLRSPTRPAEDYEAGDEAGTG